MHFNHSHFHAPCPCLGSSTHCTPDICPRRKDGAAAAQLIELWQAVRALHAEVAALRADLRTSRTTELVG